MSTEDDMFDYDDDWEISEEEAREIRESFEKFKACDHDWQPNTSPNPILAEICTKCGGGQGLVPVD